VLMHKLQIEAGEAEYLATAIHYPAWPVALPTFRELALWLSREL